MFWINLISNTESAACYIKISSSGDHILSSLFFIIYFNVFARDLFTRNSVGVCAANLFLYEINIYFGNGEHRNKMIDICKVYLNKNLFWNEGSKFYSRMIHHFALYGFRQKCIWFS